MLIISMLFCITACGTETVEAGAVNLSENVEPTAVKKQKISDDFVTAQQDFACGVFTAYYTPDKGNVNLSPYSLSFCLGIAANGAQGDTLKEFEEVLMRGMKTEDWNPNMYNLMADNKETIIQADSLWIDKEHKEINNDFLSLAKGNFNASVFSADFNENVAEHINKWVKETTNGKIDGIIKETFPNTAMYIANTVYLDKYWGSSHYESRVKIEEFTSLDKSKQNVKMMYCILEAYKSAYIKQEDAEGFIKALSGNCSFVALMPDEDVLFGDYIASLNGEKLRRIINNSQKINVKSGMPYFKIENDIVFNDTLKKMGIKKAYSSSSADFSKIGKGGLYLGRTNQKSSITVDVGGVRAAAASGQEIIYRGLTEAEEKTVVLNRPFVYIILDKHNVPLFIGAVTAL